MQESHVPVIRPHVSPSCDRGRGSNEANHHNGYMLASGSVVRDVHDPRIATGAVILGSCCIYDQATARGG